jgi:hypothetical protein
MTFTTTSVYSYKATSICLVVAFTNSSTDVVQKMIAGYTVARIYDTGNPQTGQMEVTSPPSAYNGGINAWDLSCDCGLDHEMIRVRLRPRGRLRLSSRSLERDRVL